ncbi:MAG TPA: transcription termination/antitermination NusG family protein [Rectinemataceae bacterium]|nr:transcription termination/antitermination NusG family protein [Rectinemataceae bacterium]
MSFFAIQVMSGREDAFIELFQKALPDQVVYNIKKKMPTRRMGKPISQVSCIFPGYLFFQSPDDKPSPYLVTQLRRTRHFMRILPATDNIKPLGERDAEIIRQLLSFGREIGPSLVMFDEKKRIKVIKGPLMGLEGHIVKVNRRKRRAKIRLDMNDSPILFDLSFEILESVQENAH